MRTSSCEAYSISESALGGLCIDGKLTFSNNAYPFCPRSVPPMIALYALRG